MTDGRRRFVLAHQEARDRAVAFVKAAPDGWEVIVRPKTRSLDQNAAQWPILDAFAEQLKWPVNGQMVNLTAEEWKDVLSSAFNGEHVRLAQGLSGGIVMLGMRTSKMDKATFSAWLEFLKSVAADRDVVINNFESGTT